MITLYPLIGAACSVLVAALVGFRRPASIARSTFVLGMLCCGAEAGFAALSAADLAPGPAAAWQYWRIAAMSLLPAIWLAFSLTYSRENGREFLSNWRPALATAALLPALLLCFDHGEVISGLRKVDSPDRWLFQLGRAGLALYALQLAGSIAVLMNLERTLRASVGTARWRNKFMLLGVGTLFVVRAYVSSQAMLFRQSAPSSESLNDGALVVATGLILRSLFRSGHFELSVHPSRSLLQGSITVLLAGAYLSGVAVVVKAVSYFGGETGFALKAFLLLFALALLVILLQSDRLKARVGRFVSRHFQRPLHDYRTVWRRFAEATAQQVDQPVLCRSLVNLFAEIFESLSVSLWLVDDPRERLALASSTSLTLERADSSSLEALETAEVIAHFERHPEPVEIESSHARFAELLRRIHPSEFHRRENRVCLPLVAHHEVVGVLILGDRIGDALFSAQDFDMLKCAGDHATASLVNLRLGQKLLQAKELEAFQAMAAFFVHDLKNAASTLSLMLQNLPIHFDDPAFRVDALRGTTKSVAHINHLISRLSLLRQEVKVSPTEADLNALLDEAVAGLESAPTFAVVRDYGTLPPIVLDRDQIAKVVINLVLNAREAMGGAGRVRLSTTLNGGWAVIAVRDSGGGMSADFIGRSLFRPFQTTKKNGLGIGMFQSKMIVEVHGGRISVASEVGVGTTFQVYLPVEPKHG